MKDSGIEWIGEIPEGWSIAKVSYLYNVVLGKMLTPSPKSETDTLEKYLCAVNIKWSGISIDEIKEMWFSESEKPTYLLNKGDIIISEGGDVGTASIYLGEVAPCYIQNAVHRVYSRDNTKTLNKLLYYWMAVAKFSGYLALICNKATLAHYTKEKLCATPIPVIPFDEQKEIISYLDTKCASTNNAIQKERLLIEKLKEYRQALITEAVTKGLRRDVPMKESGVEWVGEIPEHWKVTKFGRVLLGIKDGTHTSYARESEGEYLLSAKNVYNDGLHISENESCISKEIYNEIISCGYPRKGDLLLTTIGGSIGRVLEYTFDKIYAFQRSVIFLRPNDDAFSSRYLVYQLLSEYIQKQMQVYSSSSAQAGVYSGDIKKYTIIFTPDKKEQQSIASYLDTQCARIDKLISGKEAVIGKLEEYKKSLIYECVTGKKEVPAQG